MMVNETLDNNFTQEIVLPSKGLFNPEIPEGKITQRCMMVSDQKTLTSVTGTGLEAPMYQVLQNTVVAPEGFDIGALTLSDTLFLLFKLRILSYGSNYKFRTRCPECGKKIDIEVDLSTLPVETLEDGFAESLITVLPHRGDTVYTRILTNRDTEDINKEIKRRKKKNPNDESDVVLRLVKSIEKVQIAKDKSVITHPIDIERYVNALTDYDASAIIHARDSVFFGVSPTMETVCPECRQTVDIGINFTNQFFRPSFT